MSVGALIAIAAGWLALALGLGLALGRLLRRLHAVQTRPLEDAADPVDLAASA